MKNVIPTKDNKTNLISIPKFATLIVGLVLVSLSSLSWTYNRIDSKLDSPLSLLVYPCYFYFLRNTNDTNLLINTRSICTYSPPTQDL